MSIAKEFSTSLSKLLDTNNLRNPNDSSEGQVIIIPDAENRLIFTSELTTENISNKIDAFLNFIEGKKLKRPLSFLARESVQTLFEKCLELKVTDLRMISYILATTYWETGAYGQRYIYEPFSEKGEGRGKEYGMPHKRTGKLYYERGFAKLCWFDDYERFTKILFRLGYEIDLISNPDLALRPDVASLILIIGMRDGKFTGRDLDDYFDPIKADWFNARQIINGKHIAVIIADIAKEIYYIIK